jgi:hypothetical protein
MKGKGITLIHRMMSNSGGKPASRRRGRYGMRFFSFGSVLRQ